MPTFGITVDGGINQSLSTALNGPYGTRFTCPTSGIADRISALLILSTGPHNVECAILDNGNNLIAQTLPRALPQNVVPTWYDFTFAVPPAVVGGTEYGLFGWGDDNDVLGRRDAAHVGKGWGNIGASVFDNWAANVYFQGIFADYGMSFHMDYTEPSLLKRLLVNVGQ